ncbi:MAG: endonuclease III [Spirochaetales bacterium]|nr:endonuclease III [Spirochaetales bacterium]
MPQPVEGEALLELVWKRLVPLYPDAKPLLEYRDCFELLCAVVLSAQCTDDMVNKVTPALFARWPDAASMAAAELDELEAVVRPTGFYRNKARNLKASAAILAERHGGSPPGTIEELVELPGVGRKTANLVASACAGLPGIIADTHVIRLCARLSLVPKADPVLVERRIAELAPSARWTAISHALNRHGKFVCTARKPDCTSCVMADACPSFGSFQKKDRA